MDLQGAIPKKTHGVYDIFSMIYAGQCSFFCGKRHVGEAFLSQAGAMQVGAWPAPLPLRFGGTRELSF